MACDGNCAKCPVQCGASKILEKINSNPEEVKPDKPQIEKEQKTMSEEIVKAAGCGAPKDPEEIRQNAAILEVTEKSRNCFLLALGGVIFAAAIAIYFNGKVSDLKEDFLREVLTMKAESDVRIKHLEKQIDEIKSDRKNFEAKVSDAERAYSNARNTLSRCRRSGQ